MFIEDEVKCLKDLHIRTENIFFINQKSLAESNKFKSSVEMVKCEIDILLKKNDLKSKLNNQSTSDINSEIFIQMNQNLLLTLELISNLEVLMESSTKELEDMSDLLQSKNSFIEYPEVIHKRNINKNSAVK